MGALTAVFAKYVHHANAGPQNLNLVLQLNIFRHHPASHNFLRRLQLEKIFVFLEFRHDLVLRNSWNHHGLCAHNGVHHNYQQLHIQRLNSHRSDDD